MVPEVLDKIVSIDPYLFPADMTEHTWWSHKAYILVRVETKEGFVGWGECHNLSYREEAIVKIIQSLAQALKGKPAGDIRPSYLTRHLMNSVNKGQEWKLIVLLLESNLPFGIF